MVRPVVELDREGIDRLIAQLGDSGFTVIAPTLSDGTISHGPISSSQDLPVGWTEVQDAGTYRLTRREDDALFGYAVGPHSWKRFLHPPEVVVWQGDGGMTPLDLAPPPRYAFFGVRPCEMAAISIQDKVFLDSGFSDDVYRSRRTDAFIVEVECYEPGGTCFCASMGTGPGAVEGADLVVSEILDDEHRFVVRAGSDAGEEVLAALGAAEAETDVIAAAEQVVADAAARMGRTLDTDGLRAALTAQAQSERWDEIAARCLTCANCTMACPTCFCAGIDDSLSLDGAVATRTRRWDSCFGLEFSYIHGGSLRTSAASRYRQWITHKLSTWWDQFGSSGCVGCGRCITWCPVGIDITAEATAMLAEARSEEAS
ncbi:MAG: 4Fe-4S dicluster domain-containing protein [Acidimicrobiia bacterium]|nr:4Fe-4S dicluster domain-containing protein [Acidimicrobiia bacterium]